MNKKLFAGALSLFSLLGSVIPVYAENNVELKYALAETDGEIIFHLDNTSIVYDDENLEQDINYHITTTAGNYYLDNESVKNYFYFVEAEETSLSDSHSSNVTIPVEFDSSEAEGTLDLTKTVTDSTTYAGAIGTAIEKEEKAGTYVGRTTILFDAFIPIMSEATGFSYINRAEESIIVDYDSNYGSDITIPDDFEGNTVTKIGDQALMSKSLKSVSLSSGVKSIGDEALANNTELATIELNEGLESIGDKAMANTAVEEIVIPSTVETIGEEALVQETPKLTKIINKTGKAFDWTNITKGTTDSEFVVGAVETIEVTYNENVTEGTCFTYTVENNEATITDYDVECGGTDVIIPVTIDGYTVTKIGERALYNKGLTSIEIPGNIKTIGAAAVANNPLETAILHEGIEVIQGSAFYQINVESSLTTIEIPSSVKTIEGSAFVKNTSLTTVILNEGLEYIGESAFRDCNITSLELPSTVKYVSGFNNNVNLTNVTLNEGLETIGTSAFRNIGITEIAIPSTVKTIGDSAFSLTPDLAEVILPEGLETIGEYAFQSTSLSEIEIPGNVKTIGKGAFASSPAVPAKVKLTTVIFNEGLENIGEKAFNGQTITEVVLPSTVKTVGDYAFEFNPLNKIVLNEGLESIGKGAFCGHKVTEITIPSTVTYIGAYDPEASINNDAAFSSSNNVDVTKVINKTGLAFDWAHILVNTMATETETFVTGKIVWSEPPFTYNQETTYIVSE